MQISKSLKENIEVLEKRFENCGDIVKRKFPVGIKGEIEVYVVYFDVLISRDAIENTVISTLMLDVRIAPPDFNVEQKSAYEAVRDGAIASADIIETEDLEYAMDEVMTGNTLLLIEGSEKAIIISSKGFPRRGVEKPETEVSLLGSKEAFVENIRMNTVLIRRRIRDTALKCKQMRIGERSKTDIAIMYMDDIVREDILNEVIMRLEKIKIDSVIDSSYIEQYIENSYISPFPQLQMTERPDKVAAELLEGRIAIVVDNSPYVLLAPTILSSFLTSSEDYYQRWEIMSFIRILRYIAGFFAFSLPALYICAAAFNPSMIPIEFALKLSGTRQGVPLSIFAEMLIMELIFETLKEAGIRLPSAIGSTLGIVGGIVIGQAAVDAGLISPMVVIIISLTAIFSFAIPNVNITGAFRLLKYIMLILSGALGLFGFWLGLIFIAIHLSSLKSFGIPYLFPFEAGEVNGFSDLNDTFFRLPVFKMRKRPIFARADAKIRNNGK